MNVLLINGSPNARGCTFTALSEIAGELAANGIGTSILHVGARPIQDCLDCDGCAETGRCAIVNDMVNECIDRIERADGLIVGSPVYFAGPSGAICSFLDRVFFAGRRRNGGNAFEHKPAAAIVSCRRGGATASFDRLNKYFSISSMPIVTSQYWNIVHGNTPEEVAQDLEGLQTMRTLARNMAWLLRCIEAAKGTVPPPGTEPRVYTNFIR